MTDPRLTAIARISGSVMLLAFLSVGVFAQASGPRPPRPSNPVGPTDPRWQRQEAESEAKYRTQTTNSESITREDPDSVRYEVMRDFDRLEFLYHTQLVPMSNSSTLDYKRLSKALSEVSTRAVHIKLNMRMLQLKPEKTVKTNEGELTEEMLSPALIELKVVVRRFLDNPAFRVVTPNDDELRAGASHDLAGIIKLSERVNKLAKKLGKNAQAVGAVLK